MTAVPTLSKCAAQSVAHFFCSPALFHERPINYAEYHEKPFLRPLNAVKPHLFISVSANKFKFTR